MVDNKDELINHVITQHLQTIVTEGEDENANQDSENEEIDLEKVKLESYNKGLDDAKANYDKIISQLQADNNLAALLQDKLSEISPNLNLDMQVAKLTAQNI